MLFPFFNPLAPTPQNDQTHSNSLSATTNALIECAWPFCEVGAERVNGNSSLASRLNRH